MEWSRLKIENRFPDGSPVGAELYLGASGMKAQLKYADRRNAPCVVIAGSNEFAAGKVQIKDLAAGKRGAEAIADNRVPSPSFEDGLRNQQVLEAIEKSSTSRR